MSWLKKEKKNVFLFPNNIQVKENEDIVRLDDMIEKTIQNKMEKESFRENVEKDGEERMKFEVYYNVMDVFPKFKVLTLNWDWPLAQSYPALK